jgi:hypothetical protein
MFLLFGYVLYKMVPVPSTINIYQYYSKMTCTVLAKLFAMEIVQKTTVNQTDDDHDKITISVASSDASSRYLNGRHLQ